MSVPEWRYDNQDDLLAKGAEMGRILIGSTVILLITQNVLTYTRDWPQTKPVRLGEAMGTVIGADGAF